MRNFTLAITGSGGSGAISTGEMLLRAAAKRGYYGILKKIFSPQIRGGESAAIIRFGHDPVENFDGVIDALVVLDWNNYSRFSVELPVTDVTVVIQNAGAGDPATELAARDDIVTVNAGFSDDDEQRSWANMVFFGLIAKAMGCPANLLADTVQARLGHHGESLCQDALRAARAGFELPVPAALLDLVGETPDAEAATQHRWLASGNQLAGLGGLEAGIRFVAAYPITPASDALEWLAPQLERCGGHLVQAEDELAAINMVIGAGFGGVPAMTATSGPGLSLMSEGMGLAVASETPAVILDVMRGGPSTGIPTKSEQSDFNLAVYGKHGDAPHIVVACSSVTDCYETTAWATALACELQTLAVVLSDQLIGQAQQVVPEPEATMYRAKRPATNHGNGDSAYLRYLDTASGVSPMAVPGDPGCMYTADGLEHTQAAVPSPRADDHQLQLDKRLRKLACYDFGDRWADLDGEPDGHPLVICWGSVSGSAGEARQLLSARGIEISVLTVRLLAPLPADSLRSMLDRAKVCLVVEQNHGAQFCHYLRAQLPGYRFNSMAVPGPQLITPRQIIDTLEGLSP